jgi:plastocyanin
MKKIQSIILVVVAIIVLALLIYIGSSDKINTKINNEDNPEGEESLEGENNEPVGESVVEGASKVNDEGDVVTDEGEKVDNSATPGSSNAPKQTDPISEEEVSSKALKLKVSASGFEPSNFEVKSGVAVTLSVTATDDQTHIFKFKDESLKGVAVGIAPGETRAITFNAPAKGDYVFYCDVPGHEGRGESGTMTVK